MVEAVVVKRSQEIDYKEVRGDLLCEWSMRHKERFLTLIFGWSYIEGGLIC